MRMIVLVIMRVEGDDVRDDDSYDGGEDDDKDCGIVLMDR